MDTLRVEKKNDYAIVYLDNGKANVLNLKAIQEIRHLFSTLKTDDSVRGVIFTGKPHYFSAGLDVIELLRFDETGIEGFRREFLGMVVDLTRFPKAFISAISGHSPAGG